MPKARFTSLVLGSIFVDALMVFAFVGCLLFPSSSRLFVVFLSFECWGFVERYSQVNALTLQLTYIFAFAAYLSTLQ